MRTCKWTKYRQNAAFGMISCSHRHTWLVTGISSRYFPRKSDQITDYCLEFVHGLDLSSYRDIMFIFHHNGMRLLAWLGAVSTLAITWQWYHFQEVACDKESILNLYFPSLFINHRYFHKDHVSEWENDILCSNLFQRSLGTFKRLSLFSVSIKGSFILIGLEFRLIKLWSEWTNDSLK